jgi:hypothetical protein
VLKRDAHAQRSTAFLESGSCHRARRDGLGWRAMCFSPEADFSGGAIVAAVGVQTLRHVRAPRELIIGALPVLFGAHQLIEGFVWLGLRHEVSAGVSAAARETYIVFAHAILPMIVPLGFILLEPDRQRARWLWPFALAGLVLGAYLLWQVTAYPVTAQIQGHCIDYVTHTPNSDDLAVLYVVVTCGPPLLSTRRYMRWFGALSLLGAIATATVRADELTSLWCVYAALTSVLILEHFRRQRASEQRLPPATSPPERARTVRWAPDPRRSLRPKS